MVSNGRSSVNPTKTINWKAVPVEFGRQAREQEQEEKERAYREANCGKRQKLSGRSERKAKQKRSMRFRCVSFHVKRRTSKVMKARMIRTAEVNEFRSKNRVNAEVEGVSEGGMKCAKDVDAKSKWDSDVFWVKLVWLKERDDPSTEYIAGADFRTQNGDRTNKIVTNQRKEFWESERKTRTEKQKMSSQLIATIKRDQKASRN
jgi:hypothetical protein